MKRIIDSKESAVEYIQTILTDWSNWQTHHTNLVQALQILLNDNKELTEENERLRVANDKSKLWERVLKAEAQALPIKTAKADTVRKMQALIKERCIKGGIYPAFVARTIDQIAEEMLEGV